ncbi:cobalamin-binding protein [Andreprevotia chitinilytica]|uniref:cobalamin-binding protein n=1 Tax=Andreprevotia chitinilytica TaxID=396808 RepID=UPI0005534909|nr:cobalamin-binding protein [Andreprevotia chitinilytica]
MRWLTRQRALLLQLFLALASLPTQAAVTTQDDLGHTITLPTPAQRIISLAPHLTEDLFAIGAGGKIVGAVNYSDYPAAANAIPRVGGYNGFDLERIRALKPDLIVAWKSGNPPRQLAQLDTLGIPVFYDDARTLGDVPTVLERLGMLTGNTVAARAAADTFRQRIMALAKYSKRRPVRVFYQVWDRPLMTINRQQIISDALFLCGAVNVFGDLPALTPTVDDEAVLAANPEMIATSGDAGTQALAHWQSWPNLAAVKNKQLVILPRDVLVRMGPRLAEGTEALCQAVDKARQ